MQEKKAVLERIFGEGFNTNVLDVSTAQSQVGPDQGSINYAMDSMAMGVVLRDIGAVTARELGRSLISLMHRPANYGNDVTLAEEMAMRLRNALEESPEAFIESFLQTLKMQG